MGASGAGGGGGGGGGAANIFDDLLGPAPSSQQAHPPAPAPGMNMGMGMGMGLGLGTGHAAVSMAPLPPGFPLPPSVTAMMGGAAPRPTVVWKRPDALEVAMAAARGPAGSVLLLVQLRNATSQPASDVLAPTCCPYNPTSPTRPRPR